MPTSCRVASQGFSLLHSESLAGIRATGVSTLLFRLFGNCVGVGAICVATLYFGLPASCCTRSGGSSSLYSKSCRRRDDMRRGSRRRFTSILCDLPTDLLAWFRILRGIVAICIGTPVVVLPASCRGIPMLVFGLLGMLCRLRGDGRRVGCIIWRK
jgi:hypothetical protein